ncbi:MAG: ATP-binding cassette domain-containing protein [Bacteroidaceae bacterium]|nr:ATP-binding cassette domain-containing protein [Bacteroidaceae bacterium]
MDSAHRHTLISMDGAVPRCPYAFPEPISLTMGEGEHWIVYGPNGSGKTMLVRTMMSAFLLREGRIAYDFHPSSSTRRSENIFYVTFHDQYGSPLDEGGCYQLRYNQGLLDDGLPRVRDVLNAAHAKDGSTFDALVGHLGMADLMDRYIISLSSGEFRRFQLAQILLKRPRILIIENPYIGLDVQNRAVVATFLKEVMRLLPVQVVLVLCRMPADTEGFTHVVELDGGRVRKTPIGDFREREDSGRCRPDLEAMPVSDDRPEDAEILRLNNVTIQYGGRTILGGLNWRVRQGEKWRLRGGNGSGKTTLLSIICADNPQSYRCDVTLFGRRRGTGESIWDIKRHIGFVSPEMFRFYRKPIPVEHILASGLHDTVGLYRKVKEEEIRQVSVWLRVFGIAHWAGRNYMELSDGEQRLVLLARAFVKNPALLILDEPFHGMDAAGRQKAMRIIDAYCRQADKTAVMVSHYEEDFPPCFTHRLDLNRNSNE